MGLTESEIEAINTSSAHPAGNPLNDIKSYNRPPSKIIERLWIGNLYDAFNFPLLAKLRIGAVVNVMGALFNLHIAPGVEPPVSAVPDGIGYAVFKTVVPFGQTLPQAKLAVEAIKFYRDQIGVNVLVHSANGIDRAPTVVWKYLVDTGMTPDAAEKTIKDARSVAEIIHKDWWT